MLSIRMGKGFGSGVMGISVAWLMLAACGSDGSGGGAGAGAAGSGVDPADASFEKTVQPLFNQACNCHQSSPILMAPFSLKPGEAYANLVGKPAMELPSMSLVKAGALNSSYLWHKVKGTQAQVGGSGLIMPSTIPLNADELRIIERWIAAGAPP